MGRKIDRFRELELIFKKSNSVILTTHIIPDGDAIGSEIGLYYYLKTKNKDVSIINHSITPDNYLFLDTDKIIKIFSQNENSNINLLKVSDLIILIDTNEYSRTRSLEKYIRNSSAKKVCIDHHLDTDYSQFDLVISDTSYPATSQIIYEFICADNHELIDTKIATALYTGIMTDTGSFRFPRTDASTFEICSNLIKKGADPVKIYDFSYGSSNKNKVKLLSRFIDSLSFYYDDSLAVGIITKKDFEELGLSELDVDDFSTFIMGIKDVKAGFVIVELNDSIKISLRSKNDIWINKFAKLFGGGGHKNAAGVYIPKKDIGKLKNELVTEFGNFLKLND